MLTPTIEILSYHDDSFAELLYKANGKATPIAYIRSKKHLAFFKEYFGKELGLNATYVIVEPNYISKDYLSDYSSYYSTCFESYPKVCTRLHFFSCSKNIEEFRNEFCNQTIGNGDSDNPYPFWDKYYLGYIVVKPIPYNFIGFTVLKHYNYSSLETKKHIESRQYWGIRKYKINVFGNALSIHSLAFQEQDQNVAACATISIWCMLQRAAESYYVILKSPSEITSDTGLTNWDGNRLMPNEGLTLTFMANAISKNNLVTEIRQREPKIKNFNNYVRKLVYAYASLKIPIILAIKVPDANGCLAGHAISVCGHDISSKASDSQQKPKRSLLDVILSKKNDEGPSWISSNMGKLYAHDDQWGPFSRLVFVGKNQIRSSWSEHPKIPYLAEIVAVMICLYPKVRISYDRIESTICGIDWVLKKMIDTNDSGVQLRWDVQLQLSEDYKHDIRQSPYFDDSNDIDKRVQYSFLTKSFPKYIWVAKAFLDQERVFDFVYDATGLTRSNLLHSIIGYFPDFNNLLLQHLELNKETGNPDFQNFFSYSIDTYISKLVELQTLYS